MALEVQWEQKPVAFGAQQGTTLHFFLCSASGGEQMGEETETERRGRGVHVWRHSLAHAIVCLWRSKDTFR